jgi:hypothetical protein
MDGNFALRSCNEFGEKLLMRIKIVGSLALSVAALCGSMSAQAASETLTYTSAAFTSVWDASSSSAGNVAVGSDFTTTLTLSAPLGNNLNNANESSDVTSLVFTTVDGGKTDTITVTPGQGAGSSFYFTTNSSGQITGWDFTAGVTSPSAPSSDMLFHSCSNDNCASGSYNGQGYGVTGDWYDYLPSSSTAADGCTYSTPTSCGANSSGSVGKWMVAPELSASNAGTGLTLLFGGLAVLVGRRRGAAATPGYV